jgi:hypothetical protein
MATTKYEFLTLARQQLFKEIMDERVKTLDDWMMAADAAWKESNTLLPYPKCPIYPEDKEIEARAELLSKPYQEKKEEKVIEKKEPVVNKVEEVKFKTVEEPVPEIIIQTEEPVEEIIEQPNNFSPYNNFNRKYKGRR